MLVPDGIRVYLHSCVEQMSRIWFVKPPSWRCKQWKVKNNAVYYDQKTRTKKSTRIFRFNLQRRNMRCRILICLILFVCFLFFVFFMLFWCPALRRHCLKGNRSVRTDSMAGNVLKLAGLNSMQAVEQAIFSWRTGLGVFRPSLLLAYQVIASRHRMFGN